MSSACRFPARYCGLVAVRLGQLGGLFVRVKEGQAKHGALPGSELGRVWAGAGEQDGRTWLLDGAGPDGDRAVAVVPSFPSERVRFRPDREQQVEGFFVHGAALAGIRAVGEELIGNPAEEADDGAAVRERVEHADLLGGPDRVHEREDDSEDGDLDVGVPLADGGPGDHGARSELSLGVVVLGDGQPVEAVLDGDVEQLERSPYRLAADVWLP